MSEVHLVTGLPCAGKTTLAKSLAKALGAKPVVVGDLIRDARARSAAERARTQQAFDGETEFSAEWIASVLGPQLEQIETPIVLDGATPLDRVLPAMSIEPVSVLCVTASDAVRQDRFARRFATGEREDDALARFAARTSFHIQRQADFPRWLTSPSRRFELAANGPPATVLRQALSAVVLSRHERRRPQVCVLDRTPGPLDADELLDICATAAVDGLACRRSDEEDPQQINAPMLVFKPGHRLSPILLTTILGMFARAGYEPTGRAAAWSGTAIAESALAAAHLELHYLNARWGDVIHGTPSGRPALDLRQPAAELSAWWHTPPSARKIGRSLWTKPDKDGQLVVNGHIPAVLRDWEHPESIALAVELRAGARAATWSTLRTDVLGASDPARAHPASVRGRAHRGLLPGSGAVDFTHNLAHLTGGALEARRERWLWLTGSPDASGSRLIDSPDETGAWAYERTNHADTVEALG
jgi:adenylate kinase family enzyme